MTALNEERRRDWISDQARGGNAKVAVRKARRDANHMAQGELLKSKSVSTDEERRARGDPELTDKKHADIDKMIAAKEAELRPLIEPQRYSHT